MLIQMHGGGGGTTSVEWLFSMTTLPDARQEDEHGPGRRLVVHVA
jgi:hypothetical protein